MANLGGMAERLEAIAAAKVAMAEATAQAKYDVPQMETRPAPNDGQHRAFELACRHRDLNDRYAELLDEYESAIAGLRHVLGAQDLGPMPTGGTASRR